MSVTTHLKAALREEGDICVCYILQAGKLASVKTKTGLPCPLVHEGWTEQAAIGLVEMWRREGLWGEVGIWTRHGKIVNVTTVKTEKPIEDDDDVDN